MGYLSRISGSIQFDPPAIWPKIKALQDIQGLFELEVDERTVDTPEGVLVRRESRSIVPAYDGEHKAYIVKDDLKAIFIGLPGRDFKGWFRIEGEDSGDIWRVGLRDGAVVTEHARLVWEDGTIEELGR